MGGHFGHLAHLIAPGFCLFELRFRIADTIELIFLRLFLLGILGGVTGYAAKSGRTKFYIIAAGEKLGGAESRRSPLNSRASLLDIVSTGAFRHKVRGPVDGHASAESRKRFKRIREIDACFSRFLAEVFSAFGGTTKGFLKACGG